MTLPAPRSYAAFLFDMDGTLLTSLESAERDWAAWARRHGLDVGKFLPTIHGVQSAETIRRLKLLVAAQRLGTRAADCLIFEDSPAGIASAEAAGADVVVITSTHHRPLATPHRTILDYRGLAAPTPDAWLEKPPSHRR